MSAGTRRASSKNRTTSASRLHKTAAKRPKRPSNPDKATGATAGGKSAAKAAKPFVEQVEVPGARPATFKLIERALESYFVFQSSRKLGTARVEPNGEWTARFKDGDGEWVAAAKSAAELLQLIGKFELAKTARRSAMRKVEEANPELAIKGKKTVEEKLSIAFAERARKGQIEDLDRRIAELRAKIKPA
jgi:hypothetical protein